MHTLQFRKIGHKIIVAVGSVVTVGIIAITIFYAQQQEKSILAHNERAMRKVTESVINGLQTVMLAGYADIAQAFAGSLKGVTEVADFRILRVDGNEAFQDNKTIHDVNDRRGENDFYPRDRETVVPVLDKGAPKLLETIERRTILSLEEQIGDERFLTFLAPIANKERCHKCHGEDHHVRGVVKLTTSLRPVAQDIEQTWRQSMLVLGITLTVVLGTTSWMVRRTVVRPIMTVTDAMLDASRGNLQRRVPMLGRDELGVMANSFNRMTSELLSVYNGLQHEQNKLTTIILSAQEGIVVTDGQDRVVLVNPAAEMLLGKSLADISSAGFINLFDDPKLMGEWLSTGMDSFEPHLLQYGERVLSASVSTISNGDGVAIGSSCLFRDVTQEKLLEEELRRLSDTDGLTRLFNRRYLDAALAAETARSNRYGTPLTILMFDVDHFKKFNDTYGHEQGDRVLQSLAEVMRASVRSVDIPCRYGGEEFVIILPNTSLAGATITAERLRARVEQTPVDGLAVTVTIGVASMPPLQAVSGDELIHKCDQALYEGKHAGRNRVVIAESLEVDVIEPCLNTEPVAQGAS